MIVKYNQFDITAIVIIFNTFANKVKVIIASILKTNNKIIQRIQSIIQSKKPDKK